MYLVVNPNLGRISSADFNSLCIVFSFHICERMRGLNISLWPMPMGCLRLAMFWICATREFASNSSDMRFTRTYMFTNVHMRIH